MKKHIIFPILGLAFALASCNDDNVENVFLVDGTLSGLSSKHALIFDRNGSPVVDDPEYSDEFITFTVKSNVFPTVTSDQDWVTVKSQKTEKQVHTFEVYVSANPIKAERTATISVVASDDQKGTLTVTQAPGRGPVINAESNGMTAIDIAKNIKAGINIGNTLEACDASKHEGSETMWGQPLINQAYINGLKAAGFSAVRIPVAWDVHAEDGVIDPIWLDRVDEVVEWVINAGMYAIVNAHWDGGWLENNINWKNEEKVNALQSAYWTQIAEKLNAYDERLLFAATNEPEVIITGDKDQDRADRLEILRGYQKTMIDAVRRTGGVNAVRTLIVQGPNTNIDATKNYYTLPEDQAEGRLMAEIHFYDPSDFALMEKDGDYGSGSTCKWFLGDGIFEQGNPRNSSYTLSQMESQFAKMKSQFADQGIPVVLGEYGAYPNEHMADQQTDQDKEYILKSRIYYYKNVQKLALDNGLLPFAWDTGELIDRNTGAVKVPEIVNAIMESAAAGSFW